VGSKKPLLARHIEETGGRPSGTAMRTGIPMPNERKRSPRNSSLLPTQRGPPSHGRFGSGRGLQDALGDVYLISKKKREVGKIRKRRGSEKQSESLPDEDRDKSAEGGGITSCVGGEKRRTWTWGETAIGIRKNWSSEVPANYRKQCAEIGRGETGREIDGEGGHRQTSPHRTSKIRTTTSRYLRIGKKGRENLLQTYQKKNKGNVGQIWNDKKGEEKNLSADYEKQASLKAVAHSRRPGRREASAIENPTER